MATGTGPLAAQDILNKVWNPEGTAPSPTGDSVSVYMLPGSGQVTPVLGSGTAQGLGPNPLFVVQPAFQQFVLDSVTLGSTSATGTATTGLGGYKHASVYLRMSSMTGTVSTLQIWVESRFDGTNWEAVAAFAEQQSATGPTARRLIILGRDLYSTGVPNWDGQTFAMDIALATGTIRNVGWADDLRIRRNVSGGTTAPIFSYTITVNVHS